MKTKAQPRFAYGASLSILLLMGSLGFGRFAEAHSIEPTENEVSSTVAGGKGPNEYLRLVGRLRARRASVKSTREKVRQPFFSVPGRLIKVNNEVIQVFEYSSPDTAAVEAKRVSPDGKTIGNSKPLWMSTPHFFKSQKVIVIYIGDDQTILKILQAELGNQFAGG